MGELVRICVCTVGVGEGRAKGEAVDLHDMLSKCEEATIFAHGVDNVGFLISERPRCIILAVGSEFIAR